MADIKSNLQKAKKYKTFYTVWMISMAHFAVGILLLYHYKSDLANLSDFEILVIGISKPERWAKNIKNEGLVSNLRNLHSF